jgi:diguanylate cyclase (GGDEF)-like protein
MRLKRRGAKADETLVRVPSDRPKALGRTLAAYAALVLVPILVLGAVTAADYRSAARQRGVAEGRSEALVVAQTAVEPVLDGQPLSLGLTGTERADMRRLVARAVGEHDVLRLRLRDLAGNVVFSDDGSGFKDKPEDEALDAAHGEVVARLTHLNSDSNDTGEAGPESVEVYVPLTAGTPSHRVGVLEIYLPYAPISADVSAELGRLYLELAVGLASLYLVLSVITFSVSRGLRRQAKWNAYLAEHDTLTELPNRALFHHRAAAALAAVPAGKPIAIAIIDLDRFKEVNDTLGHQNGDHLLTELARRLDAETRPGDTVARLGGDEFGVILTDVVDAEGALRRLRGVIEVEALISGLPLSVEASVGFVVAPEDGTDVDELLQRADIAMYVAKAHRAGVVRYDPSQNSYDAANLGLIAELRRAIAADELVLHYQPKTNLDDGRVEAIEALVRWEHPTQGLLPPGRFVPLAEQTDIIFDLTTWVLERALDDLHRIPDDIAVAVNVSARSLSHGDFADSVVEALDRNHVPARRLIIEVTETALLTDPERAAAILGALSAHGVRISIDDFGSGQTSLGYLCTLPVDELKIDRSFVSDMLDSPAHKAVVRSIVDLGHNLSLRVVGEGVETSSVLSSLRSVGCDEAQGFLLARPMPQAKLLEWLDRALPPEPTTEQRLPPSASPAPDREREKGGAVSLS